jgi:hypothetical protein
MRTATHPAPMDPPPPAPAPRECARCLLPIGVGDWEDRHTDPDGLDTHADCCAVCS